jgi:hypothetical protein
MKEVLPKFVLALGVTLLTVACATQPAATADTAGQAVTAPQLAPAAAAPNAVASAEEPAKLCRSMQVTGTNFRERVCRTADEWNAIQRSERRAVQEFSRQSSENAAVNGNNSPRGNPR